jgi:hypothetical protein
MQKHRHQEFIRFLNAVDASVPAGQPIHAIVVNYATDKHPKVRAWLKRHPRWTFHPDVRLLGQRGRGVLRQTDQTATEVRCVPLHYRVAVRHQALPR